MTCRVRTSQESYCNYFVLDALFERKAFNSKAEEDLYAHADKDMIEFALRNLLGNAIKFSYRYSEVNIKATTDKEQINSRC